MFVREPIREEELKEIYDRGRCAYCLHLSILHNEVSSEESARVCLLPNCGCGSAEDPLEDWWDRFPRLHIIVANPPSKGS